MQTTGFILLNLPRVVQLYRYSKGVGVCPSNELVGEFLECPGFACVRPVKPGLEDDIKISLR